MKIKVLDTSFAIKSRFSYDQLKMVQENKPGAMKLKNEKGETLYTVGVASSGGINSKCLSFGHDGRDGKASLELPLPDVAVEAIKEEIVKVVGTGVSMANTIEDQIAEAIDEIAAERQAVSDMIEGLDDPVDVAADPA